MSKYYNTKRIDKYNATYNVIFGERSNGKTYALLLKALKNYLESGSQFAYVRRWKEDIIGRRATRLFGGINGNNEVQRLTGGAFEGVHYYAGRFYLCNYDENGKAIYSDNEILGYTFALSDGEHDKSTSFPNIRLIVFDEFLTPRVYLQDEFVLFMNTVSTIVRKRTDVKIYMLGNTVNRYAPYFNEMGLNHVEKMEQGTIDVYTYGTSDLTVAVEYCASQKTDDESNHYFAFDNPKLNMITSGAWEIDIYPHLPHKYTPQDVLLTYFIIFNESIFQCEIINKEGSYFTYIHKKTTDIQNPDRDIIYSLDYDPRPNHSRNLFKPINTVQKRIQWFYSTDRVYYQNNSVGDTINNFLNICRV